MQHFILSENIILVYVMHVRKWKHVLIRCKKKYEQERTELIKDMQALGIMEFTLYNILKAGIEFNNYSVNEVLGLKNIENPPCVPSSSHSSTVGGGVHLSSWFATRH